MVPGEAFSFTVGATAVALLLEIVSSRRRRKLLRRLAAEWRMTYSRSDSLLLTPKVAARFPIPGAADLRVTDVIYGTEHDRYRYVFLAEFTTGTIRTKRRQRRVGTFSEPRERQQRPQATGAVVLAPEGGTLTDQFRRVAPAAVTQRAKPAADPPASTPPSTPASTPAAQAPLPAEPETTRS